ncbi:MAG: hypothetical protein IJS05_08835 [Paludibacteraceae bacterium]|nr:hypothetical protein [Paludibacteraceae bacterium]
MAKNNLHKLNTIISWLIVAMAIANVAWLVWQRKNWNEIVFRGLQYVAMLLIMYLPHMLKSRFRIEVPWLLSVFIVIFCFSSLILGDGLDLYGRISWWDKLLHAESGFLLSMIALWLIHVIMAENDKYIYFNKWFLCLFLVMFSLGLGAFWEILEYSYDSLMGTNSQQFMATTTSSIITPDDEPLCGHVALRDSMQDLMLDFAGAFLVAVYGFIRHDKLIERYKLLSRENPNDSISK